MNILQKLVDAQLQLQSTQRNWDEECLFKCNDLLGEVIRELEERLTKDALDGELPCLACGGEVGHRINCPHGIAFSSPPVI